jgi:hypothetical protein
MRVRKGPADGSWASSDGIVGEAEAVINGDSAVGFQRHREPVPGWAWINFLAHTPLEGLTNVLTTHAETESLSRWGRVIFDLVAELMAKTYQGYDLARLQRRSLVPLELQVLGRTVDVECPEDFQLFVQAAIDQLQD